MAEIQTKLLEALRSLDTQNDVHWTENGAPSMEVIRELTEDKTLTRKIVTMFAPMFSRINPVLPMLEGEESIIEKEDTVDSPKGDIEENIINPKKDNETDEKYKSLLDELENVAKEIDVQTPIVYREQQKLDKLIKLQDTLIARKEALPVTSSFAIELQRYHARQHEVRQGNAEIAKEVKILVTKVGSAGLGSPSVIDASLSNRRNNLVQGSTIKTN